MTYWQSAKIPANGINIHYTRTGGDKPPVVLAHGFSDDGLCWTPVAEILAEDYDVIMVDARGHGRSDAPEQGYSPTNMATDLADVITSLSLHKPPVLGHSMGGATTFVLAGTYPELSGAILIEDSGARNLASGDNPEAKERQRQMRERMTNLQSQNHEELIEWAGVNMPTWAEPELAPWADAKLRFNLRALNRLGSTVVNWEDLLSRITCPALLITADPERGAIVTTDDAAHLKTLIPQLEVVHIPEAGHNIRREQPESYMKTVRDFLGRVTG